MAAELPQVVGSQRSGLPSRHNLWEQRKRFCRAATICGNKENAFAEPPQSVGTKKTLLTSCHNLWEQRKRF